MNLRRMTLPWRSLALACAAAVAPGLSAADPPEAKMLLKPVDMALADLTPKQAMLLDRVKADPATVGEVRVMKAAAAPAASGPLVIDLPGRKEGLVLKGYRMSADDGVRQLHWTGDNGSASLMFVGQSVEGLIYAGDKVYHIKPLGEGLQAVARIDQSKLTDEPPAKKP